MSFGLARKGVIFSTDALFAVFFVALIASVMLLNNQSNAFENRVFENLGRKTGDMAMVGFQTNNGAAYFAAADSMAAGDFGKCSYGFKYNAVADSTQSVVAVKKFCLSENGANVQCGNGACEIGENNSNCASDCPVGALGAGGGGGGASPSCGDGACNGTETQATCPADCGAGGGVGGGAAIPPTASFTINGSNGNPVEVIRGQSVSFNASASAGTIGTFAWDFGNGDAAVSSSASQSYAFPNAGAFVVTLTVSGSDGSASAQKTVEAVVTATGDVG